MRAYTWQVPMWAMLFLWPVYILAFLLWVSIAALLLVMALIEFVVGTLFGWLFKPSNRYGRGGW